MHVGIADAHVVLRVSVAPDAWPMRTLPAQTHLRARH
jgi:hypothetical protein